jgi:hypothetical protein
MMRDGKCMSRLDRDYRRRSPVATSSSPEQSNPPAAATNRIVANSKPRATHGRSLDWNGTEGEKVKSPRRERESEGSDGRDCTNLKHQKIKWKKSFGRYIGSLENKEGIFIYLVCHDFRKINCRIKIFEKCTSGVVLHGGRN